MRDESLEELETTFKCLANANRLGLLLFLRQPKTYAEIDLRPSRKDQAGSEARTITRQGVRRHLRTLIAQGLVKEEIGIRGGPNRFVADAAALYAALERARALAEPVVDMDQAAQTFRIARPALEVPAGAHVALIRGVGEGKTWALGEHRIPISGAVIGSRPGAHIRLDYDPEVRPDHARIYAHGPGCVLEAGPEPGAPTTLNWREVKPGAQRALRPGDLIGVGSSALVFRS